MILLTAALPFGTGSSVSAQPPEQLSPLLNAQLWACWVTEPGTAHVAPGVTVPLAAVRGEGRNGHVFVVRDDNTVEGRIVTLGIKTPQSITILSGVAPGDRLVSGDLDKLHDGAKVAVQE